MSENPFLPDFITFTGIDIQTSPTDLIGLAEDYPVEFGILFSPSRQGEQPRYPALEVVQRLLLNYPARYAAHLCGGDARDVISKGASRHDAILPHFARAQINTADPTASPVAIGQWAAKNNIRAILQCRGDFPRVASVDVLFDQSGGRGIAAAQWPQPVKTTLCGFAGGLNPDNVAEHVATIGSVATHYWIDMESGVRDENDWFSIEKCRAVCEAVYG